MSRLNLCYHLTKITWLARGFNLGGHPLVGRATLSSHGHDEAFTEMFYRSQITRAIVQRNRRGKPAQHLLLAVRRHHAECSHECVGEFPIVL